MGRSDYSLLEKFTFGLSDFVISIVCEITQLEKPGEEAFLLPFQNIFIELRCYLNYYKRRKEFASAESKVQLSRRAWHL